MELLKVHAMLPTRNWPTAAVRQHQFLPRVCRKRIVVSLSRGLGQVAYSHQLHAQPPEMTSDLEQVLFVESGFGCDQHGQNATVRLFKLHLLEKNPCRFDLEWLWQTSEGLCTSLPERH